MKDYSTPARVTEARIHAILEHASRVLRKFPRETIPPELRWIQPYHEVFYRIGARGVRVITVRWGDCQRGSLPLELLDAPEQDIHKWARDSYWSGVNRLKESRRASARQRLRDAKSALETAEREVRAASSELWPN